jgi:regulator of sirC expression with transglutaminase-like and TPR domain
MRHIFLTIFILCTTFSGASAESSVTDKIRTIFEDAQQKFDLARVKFEIDQLIDPSVNIERELARVDQMVNEIEAMLPRNADSWQKVETLRKFIYESGPWNDHRPFAYDMSDPLGEAIKNKVMTDYFEDRQGNCVTMPFLFIILGQRIGLDVWPALAPLHVLVKFRDDDGQIYNLEATSGGGPARDSHYNQLGPITPQALHNGVYLKPLDERETLAVIGVVVMEALLKLGLYEDAIAVGDLLLEYHPNYAYVMVKQGSGYYNLVRTEFIERYPNSNAVPVSLHDRYRYLSNQNRVMFQQAEALGWRER